MDTALVLVDLENEWLDKDSPYFAKDLKGMIPRVNSLISFCRKRGDKIIFITHIEKGSKTVFAEDSPNTRIISDVNYNSEDVLIKKYKISPFYNTSLEEELKGIKRVVVAGILTNLCVRSMVSDAYDRGFGVVVVKDCCVAFDRKTHDFTLSDLKATREEVEFLNLGDFMKQ